MARKTTLRTYDGYGVWGSKNGYDCIWVDGVEMKLHVYIWEKANGKKPIGWDVHHRNFIKTDNRLENFELLTKSDHKRVHSGWTRKDGVWIAKPCSNCLQDLTLDMFYVNSKGVYSAKCKICHNELIYKTRKNNPERYKEVVKKCYEGRKEKVWEYQKEWSEKNKERLIEKRKEYFQKNKTELMAKAKKYRQEHADENREYKRKYRLEHLEMYRESNRQYKLRKKEQAIQSQKAAGT